MMDQSTILDLFDTFYKSFNPPFSGSVSEWAYKNIELPPAYAIIGRLDFSTSPYLIQPIRDIRDPKVRMINLIAGVQTGKTLITEACIPYWIIEDAGPILKISQSDEIAALFTETRLIPMLKNCPPVNSLLENDKRFAAKKGGIVLPHMSVKTAGAKESVAHGLSIRYLLMDESHLYDVGLIEKFLARTNAFAGRRKIIISSTPNQGGSELEKYYNLGQIYEWHWKCPQCNQYQPYYWAKQRNDLSYAGFNWDTIRTTDDEHTLIAQSARTAWLECFYCKHQIHDNISNRRMLNDTGKYVCIKTDGDPEVHSYTWPQFVNINLSFESFVVQYLTAKKLERNTGLNEDIITFVTQVLGRFYQADQLADESKIMRGDYSTDPTIKDSKFVRIMTVDYQSRGKVKYYVIRDWAKNGNESRRIKFGLCQKWEEIEDLRKKYNILIPCVGVDSGNETTEVYQECLKHGKPYKTIDGKIGYDSWVPMKGDGAKLSYANWEDKVSRYYAPISKKDPLFPKESTYSGLTAPLVLWSNYSIKTILMNLRDNKVNGIKWLVDVKDTEYEKQLYSEGLQIVTDKKTGQNVSRWVKIGEANEYLDCEAMNLVLAIRAKCFSATSVNEEDLKKAIIPIEEPKKI